MLGVEAERGLQLRIVAQTVEMHLIQAAALIKMQEFIVDPHSRVVGVQRQHARDVRADGRRAEAPQDAHALVALLHVKLPHILKAADGVDDAGVAQMRLAERDPLARKLRPQVQQRHEIRREGRLPPGGIHPDDLGDRDLQLAQIHAPGHHAALQQLLEDLRIGVAPAVDAVAVAFLPGFERQLELMQRFLSVDARGHDPVSPFSFLCARAARGSGGRLRYDTYISCLPSRARSSVTSSAYSSWLPTGMP